MVAPPAELFNMYDPADKVFSDSSELAISEYREEPSANNTNNEPTTPTEPTVPPAEPTQPEPKPTENTQPQTPVEPKTPEVLPPVTELPDLSVLSVQTIGTVEDGKTVTLLVNVGLCGFQDKIPLKLEAYIDGRLVRTDNVVLSRTYTTFTFDFAWTVTHGQHTLRVFIDPGNAVIEKNERNNEWLGEYEVAAAPPPETGSQAATTVAGRTVLVILGLAALALLYRPTKQYLASRKQRAVEVNAVKEEE
jgi:hypothetical protein